MAFSIAWRIRRTARSRIARFSGSLLSVVVDFTMPSFTTSPVAVVIRMPGAANQPPSPSGWTSTM